MTEISIAGRVIPLVFNMDSWITIEDEVCAFADIRELLFQKPGANRKSMTKTVVELIRILGNEGLELAGKEGDLTSEWLRKNMEPHLFRQYVFKVVEEFSKAMHVEFEDPDGNKERDLVLEEINQKKTADG